MLLLALAACASGERTVDEPTGPTPPGPDTTGVVQRGTLSVTVRVDPADCAIAEQLALACAAPAGLRATLARDGSTTAPPLVGVTDGSGQLRFGNLLEGTYQLSVERPVSAAERASLAADDADVTAFGGGSRLVIRPGENTTIVDVVAGRRGSLVISEIWAHTPDHYSDGGYVELYNNGDSTVFLDGMLIGIVPPITDMNLPQPPWKDLCTQYAAVRLNSVDLGITTILQFPGSGTEYPVAPGQAIIVAQDAIDHRAFAPGALDLSRADFELLGDERDVDNPAVPNVTRVRNGLGVFGRGVSAGSLLASPLVLARRPTAPLRTETVGGGTAEWATNLPHVPRADVLDLVGFSFDPEAIALFASLGIVHRECDPWLHPVWEHAPAPIQYLNNLVVEAKGHHRRVAYTLPDGRAVLQRTRTSARDWVWGPPASPKSVR